MNSQKTGQLIAARRIQAGLTQKQLADQLHISDRTVSRWERGVGFPDLSLLEPLADALELSVLELLHGEILCSGQSPVPQAEQAARDTLKTVGHAVRQTVRRFRRALVVLAALLILAAAALLLLWLDPSQFYRHTTEPVSPSQALEVYPFALITTEDFQLIQQILEDCGLTLAPPAPSEASSSQAVTVLPEETTDQYLGRLHIEGEPAERLNIDYSSSSICLDYASGNRRCIVTAYFDGSIRKTVCAHDSRGDFRYTVENQNNTTFRLGESTRDLLAPLF